MQVMWAARWAGQAHIAPTTSVRRHISRGMQSFLSMRLHTQLVLPRQGCTVSRCSEEGPAELSREQAGRRPAHGNLVCAPPMGQAR